MSRIRDYSHTLETARIVLEQMTGSTVKFGTVVGIESLEHIVLRVPIIQGEGLPEKVIIKQISEHTEHGHPEHAMNEWAGLEFLNNVAHTKQFAPRLLGGDGDSRLLILEDMGDVSTLSHILQGAERTIIEQTLVEYGTFIMIPGQETSW